MTPTHKSLVNTKKGRLNKPWLQPQGSIIPTNQHRNPGGKCHIPWAIGNQVLANYHHYDQHQGNVIVRKFSVTYQIYHTKTNDHKTNTQSQKPITNATAVLATKQVSPQLIMSFKDIRTVSGNHFKVEIRRGNDGEPPANEHRPQPQVETATARCHSSHHNDSHTVFWFCQNWQQHQMISPRKMKMTVNQGNQLFTRCSFFTCK
jgi:hypothetical protein